MTPPNAATPSRSPLPDFEALLSLRRRWRALHARQDREGADRVFREAGVEDVDADDLRSLPETFRKKLGEFGRDWERALAARAVRDGFSFYRLPVSISVEGAASFHAWIESTLDAKGAALFFESDGAQALKGSVWDATFSFALRPGILPESLAIGNAPGVRAAGKIARIA